MENFFDKFKNSHKSWTIRFNAVSLGLIALLPQMQDLLPQLQPLLPPNTYQYLTIAMAVGNILLRFKTTTALDQK